MIGCIVAPSVATAQAVVRIAIELINEERIAAARLAGVPALRWKP